MIRKLIAHAAVMLPVMTIMPSEPPMALAAERNQNESAAFGVIAGHVRDGATKNPISNAVIIVTAQNLNEQFTLKTDWDGNFRSPPLPVGQEYVVAINAGIRYRPALKRGVKVASRGAVRVNVEMVNKP